MRIEIWQLSVLHCFEGLLSRKIKVLFGFASTFQGLKTKIVPKLTHIPNF